MKKIWICIMVLLFALVGCGGTKIPLKEHTNAKNGHHHHGTSSVKQHRVAHPGD